MPGSKVGGEKNAGRRDRRVVAEPLWTFAAIQDLPLAVEQEYEREQRQRQAPEGGCYGTDLGDPNEDRRTADSRAAEDQSR